MKKFIYIIPIFISLITVFIACQEESPMLGALLVPSITNIDPVIATDESGNVSVTVKAENAINIHVIFKENADPVVVSPGQTAYYRYTQSGDFSQLITVIAYGTGGIASSKSISIDLSVRLLIDPDILNKIAGSGSKRWVWNKSETGHWGADAASNEVNNGYQAPPNSVNPCMYDDVLVFSYNDDNEYRYQLETGANNETLVGWADVQRFFPDANPSTYVDECRDITNQISMDSSYLIYTGDDGELYLQVENSTLSFWSGAQVYKIIELTADKLTVRGDSKPILESIEIAYYHTFIPEDTTNSSFDNLVWEDDFLEDGTPNAANWTYDLGAGGWGNGEAQTYTDDPSNVFVQDGSLKIIAKADGSGGYTSARIKSENLREFTYGRVDVRAKLPAAQGTWPAIWALGANFDTVGWPSCGEIDIMEQRGYDKNTVSGTLHYSGNSGGGGPTSSTNISNASSEFHIYSIEWTQDLIEISLDNEVYFSFDNSENTPFNNDFFLIMNVAMGGTLGGTIDPSFTEDTMEIDYVRVFN